MNSAAAVVLFLGLSVGSALDVGVLDAKNRPVTKVITLLKDMVSELEKEAEGDEEAYEAFSCWCVTNDKEKTQAIADGKAKIESLASAIESMTADSSRLNTEIANLNKEVEKNTVALDGATALRAKQLGEFNEEEKDMLNSIGSLGSAVTTLGKVNSFLQRSSKKSEVNNEKLLEVATTLQHLLRAHKALLGEVISPKQVHMMNSFMQAPDTYFLDASSEMQQTYAPQSDQLFGILGQMKESFETNLANSQKEEMANQKAYEDLKVAKTKEINAGQELSEKKTEELADVDEKNARAKEDKEITEETLAADTQFLANVKERCAGMDAEYEERTKTRQMEIQAVSKALEFLSSDEAHDLFTRSFNPAMLQLTNKRRVAGQKVLKKIALQLHNPKLMTLAMRAKLDSFDEVKKTLEGMIDKLIQEKEDDIKHKDYCVDTFNQNERETNNKQREKEDSLVRIDDFQLTVDTMDKEIERLKAEISEEHLQMLKAGEDRAKANQEFQLTVADQRATQKLLTAALKALEGFYNKAALVQSQKAPPPSAGFKGYEKNASSGGVMAIIQQIIDDAKDMEEEATRAEMDNQRNYEKFNDDTNVSVDEKTKNLIKNIEVKSKAEEDKIKEEQNRDTLLGDIEGLGQENHDLHKSCDFLLKNFDLRVTARDEEVSALKSGIAMFSGATL